MNVVKGTKKERRDRWTDRHGERKTETQVKNNQRQA